MTLVAVTGQRCTTTAVGLGAVGLGILVEADPAGGCLSAWLNLLRTPGLSDLVAGGRAADLAVLHQHLQRAAAGVDVLVAPTRTVECAAAVSAAAPIMSALAGEAGAVYVADVGRVGHVLPAAVARAQVVVVSFVQHSGSSAAAAVGLERLAERCHALMSRSLDAVIAVHGTAPYGVTEIGDYLGVDRVVEVAEDPWAAAVVAGRAGSAKRLERSAWWASMDALATSVRNALTTHDRAVALASPPASATTEGAALAENGRRHAVLGHPTRPASVLAATASATSKSAASKSAASKSTASKSGTSRSAASSQGTELGAGKRLRLRGRRG